MGKRDQLEIARNILYNAANMNVRKEIILKISQKIDQYIAEYLQKEGQKGGAREESWK